jgi:hypothetical protein
MLDMVEGAPAAFASKPVSEFGARRFKGQILSNFDGSAWQT